MAHLRRLPAPSSVLTATVLLAATAAAQGIKLNGPLAHPIGGDIRDAEFTPDGTRVVYLADQETDNVFELFVAKPNVPGLPVKLAGPSVAGGSVGSLWMGPKGERVVFTGDLDTAGQTEIYSVPVAGGAVVKLNEPMAPNGDVWHSGPPVEIDAQETRVVWLANHDGDIAIELFSAPIDGGPVVKLNTPLAGFVRDVVDFHISPDGTHVVYRADQELNNVLEIFLVPITGGTPVRLNASGFAVDTSYVFDASGTHVVFSALSVGTRKMLYSAALDGHGAALPLLSSSAPGIGFQLLSVPGNASVLCTLHDNGGRPPRLAAVPLDGSGEQILDVLPEDRFFHQLAVAPDGATVAFSTSGDGGFSLERVPVDGSSPAVTIVTSSSAPSFEFSPDASQVVYQISEAPDHLPLLSVPVDGSSAPIELAPVSAAFVISPDSARVVFLGFTGQASELLSVPILGGKAPIRLNSPLPYGGSIVRFSIEQPVLLGALGHVVYLADQVEDGRIELFSAPIAGGKPPLRLNAELPIGPVEGDVRRFALGADGQRAVFAADELVPFQLELFGVSTDGTSDPVRLHEPLEPGEDAGVSFALSADGQTVVHWLTREQTQESELRAVPAAGGPPLVLAGPFPGLLVGTPLIDPTSKWAVFQRSSGTVESVPLDGSLPPVVIGSALSSDSRFSPDGTRLLTRADDDGDFAPSLIRMTLDGSAPPLHLDGGGRVSSFTLSPDGTLALFVADSLTAGQNEAFSAPLDGSTPALRLNPLLAPLADVSKVSASGAFAFYLATQDTADRFELFRVPLDGSGTSVKLNAPLVSRGNVRLFEVTPDGTRVVYHADQERDERFELYSVASDGSGPVRKLNPPVGNGDVGGDNVFVDFFVDVFALSPDGTRVAFRADRTGQGSVELLVAPVDGSAPAVRVSPAPVGLTSLVLSGYRFSPDGRSLAMRTFNHLAIGQPGEFSLFTGSTDGLRPPRRVAGPGGVAPEFQWRPGSNRIVYQLDAETRGVVELFTSTGRARPHDAPTRFVTRQL